MDGLFQIGDLCVVVFEPHFAGRECVILGELRPWMFSDGNIHEAHEIELQGLENQQVFAKPSVLRKLPPPNLLGRWDRCVFKPTELVRTEDACGGGVISVLSKFRRPRPRQSEPSREIGHDEPRRNAMIPNAIRCANLSAAPRGAFERFDRNSEPRKTRGRTHGCPVISVPHGMTREGDPTVPTREGPEV